jgi:GNAT superfamily N-acetyltransferase
MSRLTYRTAMCGDLPFIISLIVGDSIVSSGDDPADALHNDYVKALKTITEDPNQEMIVAELDDEPVGCFQITYIPGLMRRGAWRGLLEVIHVSADKRNLGLGSEMMRWAIERCRERNCSLVQLTSSNKRLDAHRFYERLGFQKSHEGFKYYLGTS